MNISEFAARLDALFDLRRYAEPQAWDFALSPAAIAALLAAGSPMFRETFNGLIAGSNFDDSEVRRVYLLVFPEWNLIEHVIQSEQSQSDSAVILTHHPVDMETSDRGFIEIPGDQLARLQAAGVSMYVLHAALDCHESISTSGAFSDALGLKRLRTFAPYHGGDCGVIGVQQPEPFTAFADRVRRVCELPAFNLDQVRFSGRPVEKVAIVAGGGDDTSYIHEAERLGCDTYLAGHWWTPHRGEWCDENRQLLRETIKMSGMNFLSGSHDGSELVVFRDRLQPLFESWGLDVELVRQSDHWR